MSKEAESAWRQIESLSEQLNRIYLDIDEASRLSLSSQELESARDNLVRQIISLNPDLSLLEKHKALKDKIREEAGNE